MSAGTERCTNTQPDYLLGPDLIHLIQLIQLINLIQLIHVNHPIRKDSPDAVSSDFNPCP